MSGHYRGRLAGVILRPRLRARAFSLVEALVVLALAGVLAGTAAPGLQQLLQAARLRAAVNDLCSAIDLTRSQAIARGRIVTLAPLEPGGVDWRRGWVVFVDANGNARPDGGEPVLYRQEALSDEIVIRSAFTSGAVPLYLAYNAAGRSCSAGNSLVAHWGTLSLLQGQQARHIKINMLGRMRVCDPLVQPVGCTAAAEAD
ncbi:GspH/FimT family pseudopilin [Rugamonas apoptosis]|uniref:Type II secretion system protein H n=1 Tax=Rugamonas apoptosis TaxID=2758570 RepID=A0A7W2IN44_9BURK|nr:GspH/FimT family pseudopilin [Rugamonas apoptosis]MBA5690319.1 GspH/FimT family pseudopilin [Rugamonas apoptosis]